MIFFSLFFSIRMLDNIRFLLNLRNLYTGLIASMYRTGNDCNELAGQNDWIARRILAYGQ